jgi:hypothetical protein
MKYLTRLRVRRIVASILLTAATLANAQNIDVYKLATCDCCSKWADHLRKNGFTPQVHETKDIESIRQRFGVPNELGSCHTARVGGYAIEGHVPADLIRKLLKDRPDARGLAVPSMPPGSPGMEGATKMDYEVLLIKRDGEFLTYAKR